MDRNTNHHHHDDNRSWKKTPQEHNNNDNDDDHHDDDPALDCDGFRALVSSSLWLSADARMAWLHIRLFPRAPARVTYARSLTARSKQSRA